MIPFSTDTRGGDEVDLQRELGKNKQTNKKQAIGLLLKEFPKLVFKSIYRLYNWYEYFHSACQIKGERVNLQ